jgi:ubiquinone/menaquinone biosynthesis C-methylase UbiE
MLSSAQIAAPPLSAIRRGRGLTAANFRLVAPRGFGDGHNSYPHSMTWFRGHLYVTTTRDNLALIKMRAPFEMPLAHWPVRVPKNQRELDQRAQVWRLDPRAGTWERVFVSPTVTRPDGSEVPVSIGFRTVVEFQGASDPAPALYMPTFAHSQLGTGSIMIRSPDGVHFELLDEMTLPERGWVFRSFRAVVPFKGRLFAAPTMGKVPGMPNVAGVAVVLVSSDPARGGWSLANDVNFGDPSNEGVFEMGVFDGHLYAGTANIAHGYQLWKTDAEGEPPFHWTRVLERGAYRGKLSQGPVKMLAFNGELYLTSAVQNGGYDRMNNVGPAAAELIRLRPDDSWDLLVGEPRPTPSGLKAPLSGYGPGFGNAAAGYFWQLCEHDGWLYLSTFDSTVLVAFQEPEEMADAVRAVLDRTTVDWAQRFLGGFDLWRSADGVNWFPVSVNGLGNPFAMGIRTMRSTEHGLFLGVTNPFGPDVAVRRAGGWRYEPNPMGGLEIWLGRADTSPPRIPVPPRPREPLVATGSPRRDREICEELLREFYAGTALRCIGYWPEGVDSAGRACEELIKELLSLLAGTEGTLADVGTTGETTAHLLRYYPAEALTGICTDRPTAKACARAVRGPRFVGDFHRFRLADAAVDNVVCVERLPVGDVRPGVLREIARVLRPGGRFVAAEMLRVTSDEVGGTPDGPLEALRAEIAAAGFGDVQVVDTTYRGWSRFMDRYSLHFGTKHLARQIDSSLYDQVRELLPTRGVALSHYALVAAEKPKPEGRP